MSGLIQLFREWQTTWQDADVSLMSIGMSLRLPMGGLGRDFVESSEHRDRVVPKADTRNYNYVMNKWQTWSEYGLNALRSIALKIGANISTFLHRYNYVITYNSIKGKYLVLRKTFIPVQRGYLYVPMFSQKFNDNNDRLTMFQWVNYKLNFDQCRWHKRRRRTEWEESQQFLATF